MREVRATDFCPPSTVSRWPAMGLQDFTLPPELRPIMPLVRLYLEREDHLDVIRLLGERQDTLSMLADER